MAFSPVPWNPRQPHTHGWRCGGKDMDVGVRARRGPERGSGEGPGGEGCWVGTEVRPAP